MRGEVIPDETVAKALPWDDLVPALRRAFAEDVSVPERMHVPLATGTLLVMPAWRRGGIMGLKVATVHPENAMRALPAVHATYLLLREQTGERLCVMDAGVLTTRRTAAASALASRLLSRPGSRTLLMIGAGALAAPLVDAHLWARPIDRVMVWNRTAERAQALVTRLSEGCCDGVSAGRRVTFEAVTALDDAVSEADVISCATLSTEPLVRAEWVAPGTHIDLVGAFRPDMRESDGALLSSARLFVDSKPGALSEAGDILMAIGDGMLTPESIENDLFGLCRAPQAPGRAASDITVFKSVGHALEDLAAAELVAKSLGIIS